MPLKIKMPGIAFLYVVRVWQVRHPKTQKKTSKYLIPSCAQCQVSLHQFSLMNLEERLTLKQLLENLWLLNWAGTARVP